MSLQDFMRDFLGSAQDTEIEIVSDDAKFPSANLLAIQRPTRPLNTLCSSGWAQCSDQRLIHRHHSEPLVRKLYSNPPQLTQSRWATTLPQQQKFDHQLVVPKRIQDRWCMSRNHSDSELLRSPKRTSCPLATQSVVASLQRKCSAFNKVVANIAGNESHIRALQETLHSIDDDADVFEEDPEPLIEQLIEGVPDEHKRAQQEDNERFIRSILDLTEEDEVEEESPTPSVSATRKIWDILQAMFGFILTIVIKIVTMEFVKQVVLNPANQLLQKLFRAAPPTLRESSQHVLPLFGTKQDYRDIRPEPSTATLVLPCILQRTDSSGVLALAVAKDL
jgi:hypothetical protein